MPTPDPALSHMKYAPDTKLYNLGCEHHKKDAGNDPVSLPGGLRSLGLDGEGRRTPPRVGGRVGGSIFGVPLLSRIVVLATKGRYHVRSSKLEDRSDPNDSSVLPNGPNIPGGSSGGLGNKANPEASTVAGAIGGGSEPTLITGAGTTTARGIRIMPTRILAGRKFKKVLYDGPERTDIQLRVESSDPVDIYGVTAIFLDNFKKDRTADLFCYRGKTGLKKRIQLRPALGEEWYLIIENRSDSPVAIHYEVFDV